jgi:outer membrane protein TolC
VLLEALVKNNVVVTAAAALLTVMTAIPAVAQSAQSQTEGVLLKPAQARDALQQGTPVQTAKVTGPSQHYVTPGPRVNLTLEDAVARARERNINIAVARVTPRLDDFSIAALQANYLVNLTSTGNTARQTNLPRVTTQGIASPTVQNSQAWNGGITQNLWWGGASYNVSWTNSRLNTASNINIRNPQFQSGLTAAYTQPLLRGFGIDSTRAAIQTNRISQSNDEITLQTTIATTEQSTRNAYWDLVYAVQNVDAAQETLDISTELVSENRQRVEIGTLAPLDVKSAESEAANNRLSLVQAQAQVRTAELTLKTLIVSGTEDPLWTSSLNPVDRPPATAEAINVEAATQRALKERTDMQQSLNNLKISDINLRAQVDLVRPQLNVTGSYGLAGLGGPILQNGTTIPSGYFDALSNIYGLTAPTFTASFTFAYPLGKSAQQANVARSKLSLEQSQANIKSLQLQIASDVASAALTVQADLETVQASQTARELAKDKLDAAQSKLDVGMATNYDVVQAQRDYAAALSSELQAQANYRKALVNFEAVQTVGTRSVNSSVSGGATSTGGSATTSGGTQSTGGSTGGSTGSGGGL